MHILCCCEHGNNRSVHIAHILKYVQDFETLTCGLGYHKPETLRMLFEWADVIIIVEQKLLAKVPQEFQKKVKLINIGEDIYPRPFNKILYAKAKALLEKDPIPDA